MPTPKPAFPRNPSFNAQHSPVGAFMSFTCGHDGSGGGIGVEIGKPAAQNLYVGVKHGARQQKGTLHCLPFLKGFAGPSAAANYDVEKAAAQAAAERAYENYPADQVRRDYGWASDRWTTPDFTFTIYSPFDSVPTPADHDAMRQALLPAVLARLEVDNTAGTETKTAVFAIDFGEAGTRLLGEAVKTQDVGFAWRRKMGVLARLENGHDGELDALQRWSVAEGLVDANPIHALGNTAGVVIEVPPGEKRSMLIAIGVYLDGIVTTGLEGRYYYTRYYTGLDDVLTSALDQAPRLLARSAELDAELAASALSPDQQFMLAHATRSYYGSTQMLDVGGEPYWVVNEGEYCMMNTLDLTVDQAFWELKYNPWLVKNELDMFSRHYAYHDQVRPYVKGGGGALKPGGLSFAHDQGVNNNFSPRGTSSYELARLTGCFSYMTMEELANWVLTAVCYVAKTGDSEWLTANRATLTACAQSLRARCDAKGMMALDSSLCGGGAEITTYDSLDESLGQARNNTYIAVKTWACWIGLQLLDLIDGGDSFVGHDDPAATLAATLVKAAGRDGVLPAVLEPNNPGFHSRILPVAESLVYPAYWLDCLNDRGITGEVVELLAASLRGSFVEVIKRHTLALLNDTERRNLFADGGLKLSSTSNNSWMSKIAIFQYVCRAVLRLHDEDPAIADLLIKSDAAHTAWQTDGISGYWACSDQFINGEAKGSRYYPRIVTAVLFMDEGRSTKSSAAAAVSTTSASH